MYFAMNTKLALVKIASKLSAVQIMIIFFRTSNDYLSLFFKEISRFYINEQ